MTDEPTRMCQPRVRRRDLVRTTLAGLGGLAVGLADFSAPPPTSASRPFALLNFLYHAGDGSGRIFANDSRGVIWLLDRATGAARSFLDLRQARGSAFLPGSTQMGLRSF